MKRIEMFLDMEPPTTTAQQKKISWASGHPVVYQSKNAAKAYKQLRDELKQFAPEEPMDGPLFMSVTWSWSYPKSWSNKKKHGEHWKTTKPDTDNLQKALKDVMEELGFFVNDSRVCEELVRKKWSDMPGIDIILEEIDDGNNY